MTITQKLQHLSDLWGRCLVGHHKDRDCHHYICEKYTFGALVYEVQHYGYINDTTEKIFYTREAAQSFLVELLTNQIKERANNCLLNLNHDHYDEVEDGTTEHWNKILKQLDDINDSVILDEPDKDKTNQIERFLNIEKKYNFLKQEVEYAHNQLDKLNVLRNDYKFPELDFSLGYRIELLERTQNAKDNN
jgi:hypothetical protein